jgi:competence protein ComEA
MGVGMVALLAVALAAGLVWYRMGAGGGDAPPRATRPETRATATSPAAAPRDPVSAPSSTVPGTPSGRGATVVVHVAGAVARPGVLVMPAGARVIDAVEGAGGALADADLDRLNLAAKLVDGQRVLVAKVGAVGVADAAGASGAAGAPGEVGAVIDLNTATSAQLESLPGIGPTLAAAIVAERDRRGGFRSVNELREVRGIGEARFADLRERVTV